MSVYRALSAHFTSRQDEKNRQSGRGAFYYCVAYLSGIDKGTGTGSVRNAYSTLERQRRISTLRSMRRHLGDIKNAKAH